MLGHEMCAAHVTHSVMDFFIFVFKKKLKFQTYMAVSKNFKTIPLSPLAWATGGLSPSDWATGPKCKKKLHLGPGVRDALNSELVK